MAAPDPALFDIPPGWVGVITALVGVFGLWLARTGRKHGPEQEAEPEASDDLIIAGGGFVDTRPIRRELQSLQVIGDRIAKALEGILAHMVQEAKERQDEERMERVRREAIEEGERRARDRHRRDAEMNRPRG